MDDLISRQAAIDVVSDCGICIQRIVDLPSAQPEAKDCWGCNCPKVERYFSEQPERKKGKWILVKGSNGKDYHKCSECLHTQDITGVKNYCPVCGADMMGEENG